MTATVAGIHLGLDTHANRPAANTVPDGSLYSCSSHSLVYKSNLAGNSWATWATVGGSAGSSTAPAVCEGRLTLTSGTAVTTGDVTAATTLYFTPFRGSRVSTYDGATTWTTAAFTEKSASLAGLVANTNYDVFVVDATLALELLAWTNDTTRATALTTQDGVLVKSGATTRRYLGTIRITGTTGQCEDSNARRLVYNHYNQVPRPLSVVDTTDSWTYASATWRQARASAGNQVDYVCGVSEQLVRASVLATALALSTTYSVVGVGIDSTSANSAKVNNKAFSGPSSVSAVRVPCEANYRGYPGIGYHYLAWLESSPSGTSTFEGDGGDTWEQAGLIAEVVA